MRALSILAAVAFAAAALPASATDLSRTRDGHLVSPFDTGVRPNIEAARIPEQARPRPVLMRSPKPLSELGTYDARASAECRKRDFGQSEQHRATVVLAGQTYGAALLAPTTLYPPVTEALWRAGVPVHYAANITGHGWRKLLRHPKALSYRIHTLPPVPPVLAFIQQQAAMDDAQAYGTLNMGAGFALFVPAAHAQRTAAVARDCGVPAWVAGEVQAGPKQLHIEPLGVHFSGEDLQLR